MQRWGEAVLDGKFKDAKLLINEIQSKGFQIYGTRNIEDAKRYLRDRYKGEVEKRYGLIYSTEARNFTNEFDRGQIKNIVARWYNDKPGSPNSCCALKTLLRSLNAKVWS